MSILPPPPHPRSWPPPPPPYAVSDRQEQSAVTERQELAEEDLVPYESATTSELYDFSEDDLQTTPYNPDYPPADMQDHKRSWPEIRPASLNHSSWPPTVLDAHSRVEEVDDVEDGLPSSVRELALRVRTWSTRTAWRARLLLQRGVTTLGDGWERVVDDRRRGWLLTRAPYAVGLLVVATSMFSIGRTVESATEDPSAVKASSLSRPAPASASSQSPVAASAAALAPETNEEISLPAVPGVSPSPDKEAPILVALAENLLAARRDAEAVPVLERALARNPTLTDDPTFLRVVKRAALSEERMAAAQTYALLTGPMGERGAEILYEISVSPDSRRGVRERAAYYVYTKDFEKKAPLPLYAAFKLVSAPTCDAKKSLLPFAAEAGGRHALAYLRELDQRKVCTLDDLDNCYSCMNVDSELPRTIAEIEARLGDD